MPEQLRRLDAVQDAALTFDEKTKWIPPLPAFSDESDGGDIIFTALAGESSSFSAFTAGRICWRQFL